MTQEHSGCTTKEGCLVCEAIFDGRPAGLQPMQSDWPRGWALGIDGFWCCHKGIECGRLKEGEPVFLTGEAGDVYCREHAKDLGW
jgi:hypothetical protein